jgi:hypothetical protein
MAIMPIIVFVQRFHTDVLLYLVVDMIGVGWSVTPLSSSMAVRTAGNAKRVFSRAKSPGSRGQGGGFVIRI